MVLLDTNIVIGFLKGEQPISGKLLQKIDDIALCSLVIAELDYGAKSSQKVQENLEKLYNFIDLVQIVPFDLDCAKTLGTIKSRLRIMGKPTGEMDALIAATAVTLKATLITRNKKHFENIEGLDLEVW